MKNTLLISTLFCIGIGLSGCVGKVSSITTGSGGNAQTGAAGGASSVDAQIERCAGSLGTVAISEGRTQAWYPIFQQRTGVPSLRPMLSFFAQQSNCFEVTTLGNIGIQREIDAIRDQIRDSGEYRVGSNFQTGQRKAADYIMVPTVNYAGATDNTLGTGIGASLGQSIAGSLGGVLGASLLNRSSTAVQLTLFGLRENTQLAVSEGSATASQLGTFLGTLSGGGPLQPYSNTQDGKATAAAFYDAFNKMVIALRSYTPQDVDGTGGTGGQLIVN